MKVSFRGTRPGTSQHGHGPGEKQEAARLLRDEVRAPAEKNVPPAEIGLINRTFYIMITV